MKEKYSMITDIAIINSASRTAKEFKSLVDSKLFSDESRWDSFVLESEINGLLENVKSRLKYKMSNLSRGVYATLDAGPSYNLTEDEEIFLFSGFSEIKNISQIGKMIMTHNYSINPALFPNSVSHISLCYFTILKKINNYCATITDGLQTNSSFISFIKNKVQIPESFVVVGGEENTDFFNYEKNHPITIVNSFVAYRVIPSSKKGFIYRGAFSSIEELSKTECMKNCDAIFCDKDTYLTIKNKQENMNVTRTVYCDYPITKDNPSAITLRLALPFYLNMHKTTVAIEKIDEQYHCFEIKL